MVLLPEFASMRFVLSRTIGFSYGLNDPWFLRRASRSLNATVRRARNRVAEFHSKVKRGIYETPFIDSERSGLDRHGYGGNADEKCVVLQRQRMLQHGMLQEIAA